MNQPPLPSHDRPRSPLHPRSSAALLKKEREIEQI